MDHQRAPLINQRFFKLQILQILYFGMSKCVEGSFSEGPKFLTLSWRRPKFNPFMTGFYMITVSVMKGLKQKQKSVARFALREGTVIHPPSKDKGIRDIQHSMIIALGQGNLFLGVKIDYGLIFGSLYQFITRCGRYYYNMCQLIYYVMAQFYHIMQQLIQNTATLLDNVTVITKTDMYYKMRRYNVTAEI